MKDWFVVYHNFKLDKAKPLSGAYKEHIIHQFGIPHTLTTNQGTIFTGWKVLEYANSRDIKMVTSASYYAQANWQIKAVNKAILLLIKKHLGRQPRN